MALGAGQLLQGLLCGVDAVEPIVLVTAPLILLAPPLMPSYMPIVCFRETSECTRAISGT